MEQAREPLPNERVLSLMKVMRDDLRQVIDHGSSAGAVVPATPVQWAAPLRHRFTRILDELGVVSHWQIAAQWQGVPSALQCLGLTRLAEEALSNVIKHSQARHLRVTCAQPRPAVLEVRIEDDGVEYLQFRHDQRAAEQVALLDRHGFQPLRVAGGMIERLQGLLVAFDGVNAGRARQSKCEGARTGKQVGHAGSAGR